ncbi:hypothetical protein GGP41_002865 [Bipolaris sorokiniana]|uniref:Rhodopsin domain-containing protein n=2 Tax=Cochliobolus sativus TaxID=45130 RepID=A0A8H6DRG1_COCSA|nr:uncharacterized protein COCSADRAFT_180882 [Bipolaris sorokiniana ND90Pr]EMD64878.1 hypothetical protein COCSADRAFT_180882 [Bipolaris sorokiniana ND90Pr]KAF5845297.1 hypothetical protein GGP41_002865 [Bipolaris sorokiniana]
MYLRPGFVVVIVGGVLTTISTIVVALRYYCRYFLVGSLSASDHLMLVSLVIAWGTFIINYYQDVTSSGYRPTYLRRPDKRPEIEGYVLGVLISWWAYRFVYVIGLGFIKLSILFFYRSIAANVTFRRIVYGTMGFVVLYTFSATIAAIFQCQNPASAWSTTNYFAQFDPTLQREPAVCWDPVPLWVFSSACNLLTDVIILLMPLPTLLSLRIPMGKRLALIGIFSVGLMAIVASSVRMWVMYMWAESPYNSARYGADLLLWGQVETNSGIISASVPFLRLLFRNKEKKPQQSGTPQKIFATPPEAQPPTPPKDDEYSPRKVPDVEMWPLPNEKGLDRGDSVGFITIHERSTIARESNWGPFVTIPESLSSDGKDSPYLAPPFSPHKTA